MSSSARRSMGRLGALAPALAIVFAAEVASAEPSTTSPEQGYELGEVQSPRAVGMGGALNALGVSTSGLYLNPANMALARVYHFEGGATFAPEARRQSYGGAVVDSVLNRGHLAGGVGANWSTMDADGIHRSWTDVRAGIGYPLGDYFAVGITGRYLRACRAARAGRGFCAGARAR